MGISKEVKLIQNLKDFARNEAQALKRLRRIERFSRAGGWSLLVVAFWFAFQRPGETLPAWMITPLAALGGAMIAIALWMENTRLTWPTLKRFLDIDGLARYDPRP